MKTRSAIASQARVGSTPRSAIASFTVQGFETIGLPAIMPSHPAPKTRLLSPVLITFMVAMILANLGGNMYGPLLSLYLESLGATEGPPAAGSADVIVDITSTGSTLRAMPAA